MTKLPLDIAREALLSAQSELRDYHYDHPVHKQIREALAALSQPVADEREKALSEAEKACELIALKWQSKESTRASGAKAGAFECLDAIRDLLKSQKGGGNG